jgi:hypothetical protein
MIAQLAVVCSILIADIFLVHHTCSACSELSSRNISTTVDFMSFKLMSSSVILFLPFMLLSGFLLSLLKQQIKLCLCHSGGTVSDRVATCVSTRKLLEYEKITGNDYVVIIIHVNVYA